MSGGNVEVEVRSFVSEEQFKELKRFFERDAEFLGDDEQETVYFNCEADVRLQKNKQASKIWMKKGMMHDEAREETEIVIEKDDFDKALNVFLTMGYEIAVKWLRKRLSFKWGDVAVTLDDNKGYGLILELEKKTSHDEKAAAKDYLKKKMQELGIELTPREVFDEKFSYYTENWRKLLNEN